jgi:hypothetical protein
MLLPPLLMQVTTEDPGVDALVKSSNADVSYGTRVCIGGSTYDWWAAEMLGLPLARWSKGWSYSNSRLLNWLC